MKIPEGWPTEEMLRAAEEVDVHPYRDTKSYQELVFEAMLEAAPTPPAQAFPDVPPNIQNIMWEVFEYANIKEGFNSLEGEERVKRRSQLFEQDAKIRRMLLNLPKNEDGQEGESVAEIVCEDMGRPFSAMQIMAHFYKDTPPVGTKLYTRPDNSELRKAAEAAIEALEWYHQDQLAENLRAALEGK